jgi:bifunctional DNase/RNase
MSVTTLRIAHAEPRPGRLANGGFRTLGHLVVLADDAGHRAVPIWLHAGDLFALLGPPDEQVITAAVPQELTARLLGAAHSRVTGVDIDVTAAGASELSADVTVARIGLAGPAGTRQVTADLSLALALAAAAGAPVRLADAVLDRVAVPVPDDDLLTPFYDRVPSLPNMPGRHRWPLSRLPGPRPRYEPRNLDFASGLDRWDLDAWPGPDPFQPGTADEADPPDSPPDYAATAEGQSAVLASAVPRPAASASLVQAIFADDYRGATVTFSCEIRVDSLAGQAGPRLEILRHWWWQRSAGTREDHSLTIASRDRDWSRYEITARIAADTDFIRFGIALTGPGRIALRSPDLRVTEPGVTEPGAGTP